MSESKKDSNKNPPSLTECKECGGPITSADYKYQCPHGFCLAPLCDNLECLKAHKDFHTRLMTQMGCIGCGTPPQAICPRCPAPVCYNCLPEHEAKHIDPRSDEEKKKAEENIWKSIFLTLDERNIIMAIFLAHWYSGTRENN